MTQSLPSGGPVAPPGPPMLKTSGLAIASLVCGLVSPCTCGLSALTGLLLGIAALLRIGRREDRLWGRGLAIAGIVLSTAVGLLFLVLAILAFLAFRNITEWEAPEPVLPRDLSAQSMIGMTALADAAKAYAAEHDGRLPAAGEFPKALKKYMEPGRPPTAPQGRALAMNEALCGKRLTDLADPERTVLFFETDSGGPLVGGRELLRNLAGDDDAYVIAFADGHIEWVCKDEVAALIWGPASQADTLRT